MNRWISNTLGIVMIGAVVLGIYGAWDGWHHVLVAVDHWGAAAPASGKTDAVLDHLNRPCKGPSGPDACGTLAQINKTAIDAGDAIVRTQLIERAAQPHIIAAMDEFGQTAKHLSSTADSLSGTAHSATRTLDAATDTIGEGKRTIAAAQPLLAQLTANGASLQATTDTLNDTLKRKAVSEMLDNLAGATGQGNAILGDFRQVADKARADYLRPVPWYMQPVHRAGDVLDIGAAIARHTP
jgi:hypothetical protein